jgi:hypothetical protein
MVNPKETTANLSRRFAPDHTHLLSDDRPRVSYRSIWGSLSAGLLRHGARSIALNSLDAPSRTALRRLAKLNPLLSRRRKERESGRFHHIAINELNSTSTV